MVLAMGWYLIGPPVGSPVVLGTPEKPVLVQPINAQAPLREWNIEGSYDTARECREGLAEKVKEYSKPDSPIGYAKELECVATDDPRLKEK